jgi:O-antigen/teichoic acid export membrane protein
LERNTTERLMGDRSAVLGTGADSRSTKKLSTVVAVAQSIGARLLMVAINAATGILTARALQPAGRGELAAMILWPVFLASALTLGVPSALTFQLRNNPEKRSQLLGAALLLAALVGLVGMVAGTLFMQALIPQYSPRVIFFARVFLLNTPLSAMMLVGRSALESQGDFAASNKLFLAPPAQTLLCLVILWRTGTLTPVSAGLAYVPMGILPFLWMLNRLWRAFRPSLRSFVDSARQLFNYGIRAYGIDLCGTMSLYVDQALVVRLLEPKMMGTYVVALSLSRMLNAFHASVVMDLFPRAVSQSTQVVREMTSRAARMSTLLTALAAAGVAFLGPYMLALLYGKEYAVATAVLRILVLEAVLSGATLVLSQAFMALERPGVITALQVTGLILTLPLMLIFVPRMGIVGAGLALLVSTTARLLFVLASYPFFLKTRMPQILPSVEDLRFMAEAAARALGLLRNKRVMAAEAAD